MPTRMDSRRAALWLIAFTTLLRLIWAAVLETSNDESYHWLYTVYPDLSFFDHPPMTMLLVKAGLLLCGGWVHPFSIRLAFVLLFAGSQWILYRWTDRWYGGQAALAALLALNLSGYYTAFAGTFALPDGPFLFFALLTYWQLCEALVRPAESRWAWLWVGLGFAGAMLSKYHAIFLPAGAVLYILITPGQRRVLRTPGPYLATLLGFLGFLPVLIWNIDHDWASFKFQGGRAKSDPLSPTPLFHEGPIKWFVGPILYLLPWIWFWLAVELVRCVRHLGRLEPIHRLLFCLCITPLLFFLVVSLRSRDVLLHWPLVGFVPMYLLVGVNWIRLKDKYPKTGRAFLIFWVVSLVALLGFIFAQARLGVLSFPPPAKDPAADLSGWESVGDEIRARGWLEEDNVFFFTNRWYDSGQLAFAIRGKRPTTCYNSLDARGFAFWSHPYDYLGRTGYFVVADEPSEKIIRPEFERFFERIEKPVEFPMTRSGKPFRIVRVYKCVNQIKPYPVSYTVMPRDWEPSPP